MGQYIFYSSLFQVNQKKKSQLRLKYTTLVELGLFLGSAFENKVTLTGLFP